MSDFFTSDWHFDHANILKFCSRVAFMSPDERRLFESIQDPNNRKDPTVQHFRVSRNTVERMNTGIIDRINECVGVNDTLWFLGDYGTMDVARARQLRKRIVCRHINMVWGNHDQKLQREHRLWTKIGSSTSGVLIPQEERERWIESVRRTGRTPSSPLEDIFDQIFDQTMISVGGQKIFLNHYAKAVWNKSHHGVWSLYGHSHSNFEPWREEHLPNAKTVDVGIDNREPLGYAPYSPWSMDELSDFMDKRG